MCKYIYLSAIRTGSNNPGTDQLRLRGGGGIMFFPQARSLFLTNKTNHIILLLVMTNRYFF